MSSSSQLLVTTGLVAKLRFAAQLARRDITNRYVGSYLGILWAFAIPMLSSAVYILVFGMLMRGALQGEQYAAIDFTTYYFLGFAPWLLFADVVGRAPGLLRENRNLIRNMRFEHQLLPVVAFFSALVAHVVLLLLCVVLIVIHGYSMSTHAYVLPVYFLLLFLFTVGIAFIVAAIAPFLPDLGQIIPILLNMYFFTCPVLYTPELVERMGGPTARLLLVGLNPMAQLIEGYRLSMVQLPGNFDPVKLAILGLFCAATFVIGLLVYRHLEQGFNDVL